MTHEEAFLADIIESPDDDSPRLIYADWLEDNGHSDRAAFIRLGCSMETMDEDDPQREELGKRHAGFIEEHGKEWAGPLANLADRYWFRRGFIEGIEIHAATLLRHAEAIFCSVPVRDVRLHNAEGMTAGLAACPHLAGVTSLDLRGSTIRDAGLRELLSSPYRRRPFTYLGRLRKLGLGRIGLTPGGLRDLLACSPLLPELTELDLGGNQLGSVAVDSLAASPLSGRLQVLDLSWCMGPNGIRALAGSTSFGDLRNLSIAGCQAGDAECEALANSPLLGQLTDLVLGGGSPDRPHRLVTGLAILVNSPRVSRLTSLNLDHTEIGDAEAEVLASATGLQSLRLLSLRWNAITQRGVRALTHSRFWPQLQLLSLAVNPIGDAGANELLAAQPPPRLWALFLMDCQISGPLQEALRQRYGGRARC
jgi:uncharacterized protein (TIGR02996 family)